MRRLHLALLIALAGPAAMAQTAPVNEGPKAQPIPNTAQDAEHAPTRPDGDRRLPSVRETGDTRSSTTGYDTGSRSQGQPAGPAGKKDGAGRAPHGDSGRTTGYDPASPVKDRPPQNKDDAEHAPTRKTDESSTNQSSSKPSEQPGERRLPAAR